MKHYVLPKRFMFRFFSGTKLFLSIFFLGSSVFASTEGLSFSDNVVTEKKDISVFVDRLSERLQGVFKEIISLSTDQLSFENASISQVEKSEILIDVQNHLYAPEILALADLGVIDANRENFYPDNYLRRYELVIMLTKYRLSQSNKKLSPVVFPLRGRFFDVAQNTSYAPYVAYAEQQGWIDQLIIEKDGKKIFSPNQFLSKEEVCNMLDLDMSHTFCSRDHIKRGAFAAVLYRGFRDVNQNDSVSSKNTDLDIPQKNNQQLISQFKTLFSLATSQ